MRPRATQPATGGTATAGGATPSPRGGRDVGVMLVPALYVLLALAVTFPFMLHPQTTLTAPLSGDVAGSISKFQTIIREDQNPFRSVHLTTVGYPTGVTLPVAIDRIFFLYTGSVYGASLLLGAVAANGLITLLGFGLTAIITFFFVRWLTRSTAAALVAGLAYGFWPHMYLIAAAAPAYTQMWMFILPIWAWLALALHPSPRRGLIAGLAPLIPIFWTPYFELHVMVVVGACFAVALVSTLLPPRMSWRTVTAFGVAVTMPLAATVISGVALRVSGEAGLYTRSLEDAYQESAHPLMYVIPGHASIWGPAVYQFLVRLVPRAANVNSYLGISVIILAMIAVLAAVRSVRRDQARSLASPLVLATFLAAAVALACFLFSLPPRIVQRSIPLPDALVIAVAPGFRGGQRFVIPLMAGMAVLAGIGASLILRRLTAGRLAVVTVALALIVGLDLFARPTNGYTGQPEAVMAIPRSSALLALGRQPAGPAFEYIDHQFRSPIAGINPCLLQPQHGKVLVGACRMTDESSDYRRWDASPTCDSLPDMRAKGVRYVIVDRVIRPLTRCDEASPDGVQLVARDTLFVVYRLD